MTTRANIADATDGYLACAGWLVSESFDETSGGVTEEHRDDRDGPWSTRTTRAAVELITELVESAPDDFAAYLNARSADDFGHDVWLTRNGHGAGFWDRGLGALGDRLTELVRPLGEAHAYWNATTGEVVIED